jgi:hypothetical protein
MKSKLNFNPIDIINNLLGMLENKNPFLKIDTQGFEPYVLMGLGKYLETISYIEVEFLFENYFQNNKSGFFYVEEILNKKFKLISLKKIVRNSSNRILWIDALYENKNKRIY